MAAKTLLSVRIPTTIATRLQGEAECLGVPLSAYVRQRLSEDFRERDLLTAVQAAIESTLHAHDDHIAKTLKNLLDQYTQQGGESATW